MAVKLDTSEGTRNVKAQAEKDRNLKFKIARIGLVAIAVVSIGLSVKNAVAGYQQMTAADKKIEELNVAYGRLKDEAAAWHEANDDKNTDETGTVVKTQQMFSAKAAGDEIAAIQTDYANNPTHEVFNDQESRMLGLTGRKGCWFGTRTKGYDAENNPVKLTWEFLTFYDAQSTTYDCAWACWYTNDQSPSDRYLVSLRFGKYNGESNTFAMSDGDTYVSSFGTMVEQYGVIEATGGSSQTTQDVLDMAGDLLGDGTGDTGGEPTDDGTGDGTDDGTDDGAGDATETEGAGDGSGDIIPDGSEDIGNQSNIEAGTGSL